jgi:hypothetical protein
VLAPPPTWAVLDHRTPLGSGAPSGPNGRGGGTTPGFVRDVGRRAAARTHRPQARYSERPAALVQARLEGSVSSGFRRPVTHRRAPSTCGAALTTPVSGFPFGGLPVALLTCSNEARRCATQGAPWTENLAEARRVAPSGGIRSEHEDPPSRLSEPDGGKYSIHLEIGRGRAYPRPRPAVTSRVRGW